MSKREVSRLSTIRARAEERLFDHTDVAVSKRDVLVLCDIAEAAERVTQADNPNVVTDPAAHRALIDALDELKEKVAALSRLGSPEGDGPDA